MCVTWPLHTIPVGYILFGDLLHDTVSRNNLLIWKFVQCVKKKKTVSGRSLSVPSLCFPSLYS